MLWFSKKRQCLPILQLVIGICIIISCGIIVSERNRDFTDGREVPWISDLARDQPEHGVFGAGMTIVATISMVVAYYIYHALQAFQPLHKRVCRFLPLSNGILLFVASGGLCLLAWFNNDEFDTVHSIFTAIFFACVIIFLFINLITWVVLFRAYRKGNKGSGEGKASGISKLEQETIDFVEKYSRTAVVWKAVAVGCTLMFLIVLAILSFPGLCETEIPVDDSSVGETVTCIDIQNAQSIMQYLAVLFILVGVTSLTIDMGL